ncbi:MAG: MATE family efflux transporter [Lachnospiraceae bacterium]|nr:MATE family efflux transporter [Lachnospiraceae bacterium]
MKRKENDTAEPAREERRKTEHDAAALAQEDIRKKENDAAVLTQEDIRKKENGAMDLTQGDILKSLAWFAAPILIGQLLQTLYNSVDSIVVGRFVGTSTLAAVTASATITQVFVGFFNGMAAGASVVFSRNFGAGQYLDLKESIHTAMTFSLLLGLIIAGLGVIAAPLLLHLVSCPDDVYAEALVYLRIYMGGALFMSLYNVGASVLRSVGNSRSPFWYLVTSSSMNIALDVLFVRGFRMGVAGVTVATVIAQFTSVALAFRKMMMADERYRFSFRELKIRGSLLGEIVRMGLPAGIQACVTSLSSMFLQRYINEFSSAAIAGIGSAMRIDQFAGMPCNALGLAMTTYIGQNLGAKKPDRARKGVWISLAAACTMVVVVGIPSYFFAERLVGIFSSDPEVIQYGAGMLHVIMPVYLVMGFQMLFGGIIRGYGYSQETMYMTLGGIVAVRQLWLAVALHFDHNIKWIYWGYPVGWGVTALLMLAFYLLVIQRKPLSEKGS